MGSTRMLKKTKTKEEQLTDRQRAFVNEYIVHHDGKRAAIAAGYSPKVASVTASKLLKKKTVGDVIAYLEGQQRKEHVVEANEVLEHLIHCVTRTSHDYIDPETGHVYDDLRKLSRRAACAVDGITQETRYDKNGDKIVTTKLKLVSKAAALDMAMKHKGLFEPEKHIVQHGIDWSQLFNPTVIEVDPIEKKIEEGG